MQRFHCQSCRTEVHFLNTTCVTCDRRLGYLPETFEMTALEPAGDALATLSQPSRDVRLCYNARYDACNWLVPADGTTQFCVACASNRTIPDLSIAANLSNWRKIEQAKHQLFYSLMRWRLPIALSTEEKVGPTFDFLADTTAVDGTVQPILTGHNAGVITLNIAEADDAERESRRTQMREPYRTLLGHFRHESGHYYYDILVRDGHRLAQFRDVFGNETVSYEQALKKHYDQGPPSDWQDFFITSYASTHPWEDFSETWAQYIHIVDSLETARAYGMSINAGNTKESTVTTVEFQPYAAASVADIIEAWVPLTVALNSINRSMGQRDFYPFILSPPVMAKLQLIHDIIHGH